MNNLVIINEYLLRKKNLFKQKEYILSKINCIG